MITGTSSGIGKACAEHLAAEGRRVFGLQRRPGGAANVEVLLGDVNDEASVNAAVAEILARAGRLDAVVNNAGNAFMGSIEDTSLEEARAQMETNFFGVLRVCRAVLPVMRAQRSGHIVNVSSLAGVLGLPFSGLYSASKFAVEGLTESLRLETRHFGIRVSLLQPGDFDTGLPAARRMTALSQSSDTYRDFFAAFKAAQDKDEAVAPKPLAVAKQVAKILASRSPALRYRAGRLGQLIVVPLKKLLPQRWFEWILRQALPLPRGLPAEAPEIVPGSSA